MSEKQGLRLTLAWGHYPKGHTFTEMPPNQMREMARLGKGTLVTLEVQDAPNNRMIGGRRGKGGRVTK